jgi:hypothetical protein
LCGYSDVTFTPSTLVFTAENLTASFEYEVNVNALPGQRTLTYSFGGDYLRYNITTTSISFPLEVQGSVNATRYPITSPTSPMTVGTSARVTITPSHQVLGTSEALVIVPSSPYFTFNPATLSFRPGVSFRSIQITAAAPLDGYYNFSYTLQGERASEYTAPQISPMIYIQGKSVTTFTTMPSYMVAGQVSSPITVSLSRPTLAFDNITITPSSSSGQLTFTPSEFFFSDVSSSLTFTIEASPAVSTKDDVIEFILSSSSITQYFLVQEPPSVVMKTFAADANITIESSSSSSTGVSDSSSTGATPSSSSSTASNVISSSSSSTSTSGSISTSSSLSSSGSPSSSSSSTGISSIPSPSLVSVAFNPAGSRIVVTFDQPTNCAGAAITTNAVWPRYLTSCFTLIDPTSDYFVFGSTFGCLWSSESTFEIVLGRGAMIMPTPIMPFDITLLGNIIAHRDQLSQKWNGGTYPVSAPSTTTLPIVTLVGPNELGSCSDLELDASQVTGVGRTTWMIMTWNVSLTYPSGASIAAQNGLASLRDHIFNEGSVRSMIIPASYLTVDTVYSFSVTVTNWLMATSLPSVRMVRKRSFAVPTLTVSGPSSYRSGAIQLLPSLTFSPCAPLNEKWLFTWSLSSIVAQLGVTGTPLIPSLSTYKVVRNLVIASNTLTAGFDYTWMVNATSATDSSLMTSSTLKVSIIRSSILAMIANGNRMITPSLPLSLDASPSYDPDDSSTSLSYLWSCTIGSIGGNACTMPSGFDLTQMKPIIPTSFFDEWTTYIFSVTVTGSGRSSLTSVTISTSARPPAPVTPVLGVTITCQSPLVEGYVVPDYILRLTSTVSLVQGSLPLGSTFSYTWTERNGLDLSDRRSIENGASLVLPAGNLAASKSYTFRIVVNLLDLNLAVLATGYAELTLSTPSPPATDVVLAALTITPAVGGIALSTLFTFSLNNFFGELEPFTYSFKQVNPTTGVETTIGSGTSLSQHYTSTYLPSGFIIMAGYVTNQVGQRTRVLGNVTVLNDPILNTLPPPGVDDDTRETTIIDYVKNITNTILNDTRSTSDNGQTIDIIRIITDLLNSVGNSSTNATSSIREELRNTLIGIISDIANTLPPDQVAKTLEGLTGIDLDDDGVTLTIDVINKIIDTLLGRNPNVILPTDEEHKTTGDSVTNSLNDVLNTTRNCTNVDRVTTAMAELIDSTLVDTVVGENPVLFVGGRGILGGTGARGSTAGTSPIRLTLGGTNVIISPEATSNDDGAVLEYNDVQVLSLSRTDTITQCYTNATNTTTLSHATLPVDTPLTPITVITVTSPNGTELPVQNLTDPITFTNIIDAGIQVLQRFAGASCPRQPVCSWYDRSINEWSSSGCTTVSVKATDSSSLTIGSEIQCQCNHLTEFAVLARYIIPSISIKLFDSN